MPFLRVRTIVFLQVLAGMFVASQSTDVVCMPGWSWASNSRGQNPCLVGAYILGVCEGPAFRIPPLPASDYSYTGPQKYQDNYCQCSTVTFSLMSACGLCQNATAIAWSTWSFNCTTEYLQQYIGAIPLGTGIPAWAYLDVKSIDRFNPYIAQQAAGSPESSATSFKPTQTWLSTTTATPNSKKKSNVGPIVGGVLGGLVGLTLIVAFVATMICYIRRRRRWAHTAPSTHATGYLNSRQTAPPFQHDLNRISHVPSMASKKLYDPSDPSTYPTTPLTPTSVYTTKPPIPMLGYPGHGAPAPIL